MEKAVNLHQALRISAGCPPRDLRWLAEQARGCRRILELGTLHGRSTRAMLDNSEAHVWCVDTWRGSGASIPGGPRGRKATKEDYQQFLENTSCVRGRITILKMTTQKAAQQLTEDFFDLVFIDADHSYEAVRCDIISFAPLVKVGGLLCGHDYNRHWPGVVRAVTELITYPQGGGKNIWWARKEKGWLT